jgi:acyl carrier protein
MNVKQRVKQFIVENFYVSNPSELADDASLIQGGWIDSTGMLEMITFIEQEYGIRIVDTEMTPENLDSIDRIATFVAAKRPATT